MGFAKELNSTPISDSTPEYHFGNMGLDNMWIEFEKKDSSIWRGSFECGESNTRKIFEVVQGHFLIIAQGIGYLIHNDSNSLKFKVDIEKIIFTEKISDKEFLIANWTGFYLLDFQNKITKVADLNSLDWIIIEKQNEEIIIGKFDSSRYHWKTKFFRFDKRNKKFEIRDNVLWERIKNKFTS